MHRGRFMSIICEQTNHVRPGLSWLSMCMNKRRYNIKTMYLPGTRLTCTRVIFDPIMHAVCGGSEFKSCSSFLSSSRIIADGVKHQAKKTKSEIEVAEKLPWSKKYSILLNIVFELASLYQIRCQILFHGRLFEFCSLAENPWNIDMANLFFLFNKHKFIELLPHIWNWLGSVEVR